MSAKVVAVVNSSVSSEESKKRCLSLFILRYLHARTLDTIEGIVEKQHLQEAAAREFVNSYIDTRVTAAAVKLALSSNANNNDNNDETAQYCPHEGNKVVAMKKMNVSSHFAKMYSSNRLKRAVEEVIVKKRKLSPVLQGQVKVFAVHDFMDSWYDSMVMSAGDHVVYEKFGRSTTDQSDSHELPDLHHDELEPQKLEEEQQTTCSRVVVAHSYLQDLEKSVIQEVVSRSLLATKEEVVKTIVNQHQNYHSHNMRNSVTEAATAASHAAEDLSTIADSTIALVIPEGSEEADSPELEVASSLATMTRIRTGQIPPSCNEVALQSCEKSVSSCSML
eukprot:TRINITY_DN15565_c0_g1_i1.p1 TRINITY_DN15565_c0_g1~~TRINITY_DN15565_c0_g1_i1.p1  ORF type:complete len:348 (-),score=73.49 TRINITY_DN15565_c0_g1_i1:49-1053(-)